MPGFPFLFGGTFIEGVLGFLYVPRALHFPSFSEGLSLRGSGVIVEGISPKFPFLFGGTFIEGTITSPSGVRATQFPFLFGGTFIEGSVENTHARKESTFPFLFGGTFIEGQQN